MKKRTSKLRLNRETLRLLDWNLIPQVAGGKTTPSDCIGLCTANCPVTVSCQSCNVSCDSDCFSCAPDCPQTNPTAGSCQC